MKNKPGLYSETNIDAVIHNMNVLKSRLEPGVRFMAVVKADAYGHGDIEVAKAVQYAGADYLGVARIDEGIRLRQAGINLPILVFSPADPSTISLAVDNDLTITIASHEAASEISNIAARENFTVKAHLKIDTGMGRIGILPTIYNSETGFWDFCPKEIKTILQTVNLQNIFFEGIFTHFATSDEQDRAYTESQLKLFVDLIRKIEDLNFFFKIRHAANSAAILRHPDSHLDMVRAGIALYGLNPFSRDDENTGLAPAMSLKSKILHLKKIPKTYYVSYGRTWKADSESIIATVGVGYADGYSRAFSSKAFMLVNGERAPVVGRVCMDLTMIDVTKIANIAVGDEIVIFGKQGDDEITASELADISGTINYEIVSRLTSRVQKFYIKGRI